VRTIQALLGHSGYSLLFEAAVASSSRVFHHALDWSAGIILTRATSAAARRRQELGRLSTKD